MSAKQSRNQQRKAAYAALANKDSRNQEQLAAPIVGRFVEVDETKPCPACKGETWDKDGNGCENCDSSGCVVARDSMGRARKIKVIVHGEKDGKSAAPASTTREPNAQKRRRQEFAWSNCRAVKGRGEHHIDGYRNCRSCGCPASEAKKEAA